MGVIRHSRPIAARSSSFAEITARSAVAGPILRKYSRAYIATKRRIRPVAHACDVAVFDRVDVAIFDMPHVVGPVADQMLPEPALPDAALAAATRTALSRSWLGSAFANQRLISCQRAEKSQSPGDSFQIACR